MLRVGPGRSCETVTLAVLRPPIQGPQKRVTLAHMLFLQASCVQPRNSNGPEARRHSRSIERVLHVPLDALCELKRLVV